MYMQKKKEISKQFAIVKFISKIIILKPTQKIDIFEFQINCNSYLRLSLIILELDRSQTQNKTR